MSTGATKSSKSAKSVTRTARAPKKSKRGTTVVPQAQITALESNNPTRTSLKTVRGSKDCCVLSEDILDDLVRYCWYHGLMPREEVEEMLLKNGDFVVRKTDVQKHACLAVSVFYGDRVRHIVIKVVNGKWYIRDHGNENIGELITQYVDNKWEVQKDGAHLINAIPRPDYYILHEHVQLEQKLGSGNFGDVFKGTMKIPTGGRQAVAVKILKGIMGKAERIKFVKEASLTRKFNHANIVQLLGVAAQQEPIMIILELAVLGSLEGYLRKNPDLEWKELTKFVIDAAEGMSYLSSQHVIHRDIAARNCLLGSSKEVKISDFGLSVAVEGTQHQVKESRARRGRRVVALRLRSVPIRWLSPETIQSGVFSTKSDVWSFGIMIWEIFTRCKNEPYPAKTNAEVKAMIVSDQRMKPPQGMPVPVVDIMYSCWLEKSEDRPDFQELVKKLNPIWNQKEVEFA
uniref:Tyrosine-protein kinase n=1 Tax=Steinernema glaseri TaxID=37863 RepID=A0A1I8ASS4_9BILA